MTYSVRFGLVVPAVLVASAAVLLIAAERASGDPTALTVHEWGTFTSVAGEDGSAIEWDALGCANELPQFVNDFGYRGFKWRLRGTVRMETPVMYFYSPHEVDVHVKVAFPRGLITEWYPRAEYEVYQASGSDGSLRRLAANLNGIDLSLNRVTSALEWSRITVQPNTAPALPVESAPNRYYAARQTDAAPIAVGGQHEKFLFYRGVGRFPISLSARLSADGKVVVENHGPDAVPSVILFENREGRLGYRNAGIIEGTVALDRPALDDAFPQLRYDLENALVEQGLFVKEAHAMVETWRDSWFEEGARLIYIMPSRAVDAMLPLRIEPAPSDTSRVFVGRIELISPETRRSVQHALASSDWDTIDRYGRFLEPILNRIETGNLERANETERLRRHIKESNRCQLPTLG